MAIYHCSVKIISRSAGRSSVAAAAYRAGEKLRNNRDGITHDYSKKSGIFHSEIILPENAPTEFQNRSTLWNTVEKSETRINSQTAREIEIALPVEFDFPEQIELTREYIAENFVAKGMCADFSLHDNGDGNPHAHIMLTMREVSQSGFTKKNRDWNDREHILKWRENWAEICNERLHQKGIDERIDHRTLEAQGIGREPTIHLGRAAHAMTEKGQKSDRADELCEIKTQNITQSSEKIAQNLHKLKKDYKVLNDEIIEAQRHSAENRRSAEKLKVIARDIERDSENIRVVTAKLEKLQTQRENTGFFESKKKSELDEQIESLTRSKERAETNFVRKYGVDVEDSALKLDETRHEAEHFRYLQRISDGEIAYFKPTRDAIELEYKTQNLLAQTRPDYEKIFSQVQDFDAQKSPTESLHEYLSRINHNRQLDKITDSDFSKILENVTEDQAKILLERREKEAKIKERIRRRER